MASISDRTDEKQRGGAARDSGAPLSGRTMLLFAGMVLSGSLTLGLITSAVASLLVPENQIGLRPYLVSSLPAVLMLFIAILPGLWCYWLWRQIFPPAERPKRRELPKRRPPDAANRPVVPRAATRAVPRPADRGVTERAEADLAKRREERRRQAERRREEARRREAERRREEHRRRVEERRLASERAARAAEERRRAEAERHRAAEAERAERRRRVEERRRREAERMRSRAAPASDGASASAPSRERAAAAAVRATPLAELGLPRRVYSTLRDDGIETIEQLTSRTQAEVLELRGIGARSLDDILAALDRAGRALRYPQRFTRIG